MAASIPSTSVFLSEDSLPIRRRIAEMLAPHARVVGEASTPHASIDGILALRPDVVVLDIQLEGGAGMEVLLQVRRADPSIAFVVCSNSAAPSYRRRYLDAGADFFLDKTSEIIQLPEAVLNAARSHQNFPSPGVTP